MDAYALLNDADREFARTSGMRCEKAEDLFVVAEGGDLVWSLKGLQFLKLACEQHQLPYAPASLSTLKDVYRLAIEMSRVRMARLTRRADSGLRDGSLAPQERDFAKALVNDDLTGVLDAAERATQAEQAGENVIPVAFKR